MGIRPTTRPESPARIGARRGTARSADVEERRQELTDAQQRRTDAQNEILKLRAQKTDLETDRGREIQQSEFALNEARRQMNAAAEQLSQNTQVISPMDGRVLEVKISPGSVLAVGTPVIEIESEGVKLLENRVDLKRHLWKPPKAPTMKHSSARRGISK